MQTYIRLDDARASRRMVIETKFTGIVTAGWRREVTLRSENLCQIYAYLRSQIGQGDALGDHAEGVLLDPTIGEAIEEAISVHGHRMRFSTVDLAADGAAVRQQLLELTLQFNSEMLPDKSSAPTRLSGFPRIRSFILPPSANFRAPARGLVGGEIAVRGAKVALQLDCVASGERDHRLQPEGRRLRDMRAADLSEGVAEDVLALTY